MKRLNRKLIRGTNWALAGILSILGFSGCDDVDGGGGMVEYGTPTANFKVSGKVLDSNGNGLQGIQVTVPRVDHCQRTTATFIPDQPVIPVEVRDTFYTKADGRFEYDYPGFPSDTVRIQMKFEDVSASKYASDSTAVSFLGTDLEGGKGWNQGAAEKEIEIKLKEK